MLACAESTCAAPSSESVNLSILGDFGTSSNTLGLMVRRRAIAGAACVHLAAMRAVSNHGYGFGFAAILRDALASLGLLRMRSEVVERFTGSEEGASNALSENSNSEWRPSRRMGRPHGSRRRARGCGIGIGPRSRLLTMRPRGTACALPKSASVGRRAL